MLLKKDDVTKINITLKTGTFYDFFKFNLLKRYNKYNTNIYFVGIKNTNFDENIKKVKLLETFIPSIYGTNQRGWGRS